MNRNPTGFEQAFTQKKTKKKTAVLNESHWLCLISPTQTVFFFSQSFAGTADFLIMRLSAVSTYLS